MSPTIAIAAIVFAVLVFIDVLRANRAQRLLGPTSPEPDEHQSCDVQSEIDWRVAAQVRAISDFHSGSISPKTEQDHA